MLDISLGYYCLNMLDISLGYYCLNIAMLLGRPSDVR